MTATFSTPRAHGLDATPASPGLRARPAAGLTVLALSVDAMALAGYLLRHGPALALVELPQPPLPVGGELGWAAVAGYDRVEFEALRSSAIERALLATASAGFSVHAVETLIPGGLRARLRSLRAADVACVVTCGRDARAARALARAAHAPVLILPDRAAAAGGPAVIDAREAERVLPAAARCLATDRATLVAGYDPVPTGTLLRSAAHPLLVPRLEEMETRHRRDELEDAERSVDLAAIIAAEQGVATERAVVAEPDALLKVARSREGLIVAADHGGWRAPRALRAALRERRPALLVPT